MALPVLGNCKGLASWCLRRHQDISMDGASMSEFRNGLLGYSDSGALRRPPETHLSCRTTAQ